MKKVIVSQKSEGCEKTQQTESGCAHSLLIFRVFQKNRENFRIFFVGMRLVNFSPKNLTWWGKSEKSGESCKFVFRGREISSISKMIAKLEFFGVNLKTRWKTRKILISSQFPKKSSTLKTLSPNERIGQLSKKDAKLRKKRKIERKIFDRWDSRPNERSE